MHLGQSDRDTCSQLFAGSHNYGLNLFLSGLQMLMIELFQKATSIGIGRRMKLLKLSNDLQPSLPRLESLL